ncbi:fimbrial protein [Paraburkholderia phytofirmans]|uniref:Fimbrial protein n=1 Tax=Paraburkholderia phytofirmans TaxID=261302 RepID=A0ABW9BLG3_9BURK
MTALFNFVCCVRRSMHNVCFGRRNRMRIAVAIAASSLALGIAFPAHAACRIVDGFAPAQGVVNWGIVAAPTNVTIGSVIAKTDMKYDSLFTHQSWHCDGSSFNEYFTMDPRHVLSDIFETNIPGLGVRASVSLVGEDLFSSIPLNFSLDHSGQNTGKTDDVYVFIELVVTGPIDTSATDMLSYNAAGWHNVRDSFDGNILTLANLMIYAQINSPTCSVTQSSVAVTLPPAPVANLSNPNSTTGATPFNLQLNCSLSSNVNVTLTDATDVSNRSTTLNLAPGSSASGVGLQILNGSTPIAYGPDSAAAGNMNQWLAGRSAGGPMTIPLTAQYVRASGALVPGTVKATATFTMSYQ